MKIICLFFAIIVFIFSNVDSQTFDYIESLHKCNFNETFLMIGCVVPSFDILDDLKIANITRARALRIVEKCQDTSKCLAPIKCVQEARIDKLFDLFCDAVKYFTTDFTKCQQKILKHNPPCIKTLREKGDDFFKVDASKMCERMKIAKSCFETEVTNICGIEYWQPLHHILDRFQKLYVYHCKFDKEPDA